MAVLPLQFMQRRVLIWAYSTKPQLNVKEYQQNDLKRYLERFDRIYSVHEGPYAAGQKVRMFGLWMPTRRA